MNINNDNISFGEKIKFIKQSEFKEKVKGLSKKKHYVGWPWTADTLKTGKNLYTDEDTDCLVVAIKNGSKYKLAHLGIYNQKKARNNNQKGFCIENVKRRLLDGLNLENENLHAYIMGGFQYNKKITEKLKNFFDDLKIPYTEFTTRKDVHYYGKYSYFFSNKDDTVYITTNLTESEALQWDKELPRPKEVAVLNIKDKTKIIYNTYKKNTENFGYDFKRNYGDTKDFLESQFENVKLSKFDNFY